MSPFLRSSVPLCLVLLLLLLSSCSAADASLEIPKAGYLAPDFSLQSYDGSEVSLSDFNGTPVLLNFWAGWCTFCIEEIPMLARMQKEFGSSIVIMAVNRGQALDTPEEFIDQSEIEATGMTMLFDPLDRVFERYQGVAMPMSVFIDKEGIIYKIIPGPLKEEQARILLDFEITD